MFVRSHADYRDRLPSVIDDGCAKRDGWPARAREAIRAVLTLHAGNPLGAELLAITVLCTGGEGARRHFETIDAIAPRLRDSAPAFTVDYPCAEWNAVASMGARVGRAASLGDRAAILDLERDFSPMIIALTAEAR